MVCYRDLEYLTSCTHRQPTACLAAHVDLSDCPTCSESTPVHSHPVDSNPSLSKTCYQKLLLKSHVYRDVECACHNFSTMYDSSNNGSNVGTHCFMVSCVLDTNVTLAWKQKVATPSLFSMNNTTLHEHTHTLSHSFLHLFSISFHPHPFPPISLTP